MASDAALSIPAVPLEIVDYILSFCSPGTLASASLASHALLDLGSRWLYTHIRIASHQLRHLWIPLVSTDFLVWYLACRQKPDAHSDPRLPSSQTHHRSPAVSPHTSLTKVRSLHLTISSSFEDDTTVSFDRLPDGRRFSLQSLSLVFEGPTSEKWHSILARLSAQDVSLSFPYRPMFSVHRTVAALSWTGHASCGAFTVHGAPWIDLSSFETFLPRGLRKVMVGARPMVVREALALQRREHARLAGGHRDIAGTQEMPWTVGDALAHLQHELGWTLVIES